MQQWKVLKSFRQQGPSVMMKHTLTGLAQCLQLFSAEVLLAQVHLGLIFVAVPRRGGFAALDF